jgi:hypothetical protein
MMVVGTSRVLVLLAVTSVWRAVNVLLGLYLLQLTSVKKICLHRHNLQWQDYFGSIHIHCLFYYCVSQS